jgi:hypothetical protein
MVIPSNWWITISKEASNLFLKWKRLRWPVFIIYLVNWLVSVLNNPNYKFRTFNYIKSLDFNLQLQNRITLALQLLKNFTFQPWRFSRRFAWHCLWCWRLRWRQHSFLICEINIFLFRAPNIVNNISILIVSTSSLQWCTSFCCLR